MKKIYPVLLLAIALLPIQLNAQVNTSFLQKPVPKLYKVPFGKKLPPPSLTIPGNSLPGKVRSGIPNLSMQRIKDFNANDIKKDPARFKQQILQMRDSRYPVTSQKKSAAATDFTTANEDNSDFHITRDINALAESYPSNSSSNFFPDYSQSFAVLNNVIYFAANDAIHGIELWRSDGTSAGTYMLKNIVPGAAFSNILDITAANGKLYFAAYTPDNGYEPWVSDGTESGTQLLMDIYPGAGSSYPLEFVALHDRVYFAAGAAQDELWKTDGTTAGTKEVADIGRGGSIGYAITQLTTANNLLFFTFENFNAQSWQLWKSDGTNAGTSSVTDRYYLPYVPAQLTKYDNKLYFSADDGAGRKLWVSDGTDAGTHKAANEHGVLVYADYFGIKFPVLNNVLYIPNINAAFTTGALYKYDASNNDGMVKVKGFVSDPNGDFIVASEMEIAHNMLYFKVTSLIGGLHDELWSSGGDKASTQLTTKFTTGETISNLYEGTGTLYFVKHDKILGTELWKLISSPFGSFPIPESDVFKGPTGSYPSYLTAFNDKLFFSATDDKKGNELIMTNTIGIGATVVKDINTTSTSSSYAGENLQLITSLNDNVLFDAFEDVHGYELYKSNGTETGTILLNDIIPGEASSFPQSFLAKNNSAYFLAYTTDTSVSIYSTNATKAGLQKITPDYNIYYYYLQDFKVANNGMVFYVLYNGYTGEYELWRSNGTTSGTLMLSSSVYSSDFLNVIGNNAFFVAGDNTHGYELWKSNGSIAGTKMVKDINHGSNSSYPGGMFAFNNEIYFGANDGSNSNGGSGAGFWKSDGTDAGTIKLKDIDPWWGFSVAETTPFFCVSNNMLYFSAVKYGNSDGTKLWRTDGTPHGTQEVKDTKPNDGSVTPGPYNLTDVNGTLFFMDFSNTTKLWKSDGTAQGTKLIKNVTPFGIISNLVSYGGKLYFILTATDALGNVTSIRLWSSDGTENGTQPVNDAFLNTVDIYNLIAVGNKLFVSGYTSRYGVELYEGEINEDGKFVASSITNSTIKTIDNHVQLYPNPAKDLLNININSADKNVTALTVTDVSGKIVLNKNINSIKDAAVIQLNVSHLASGTYFIKLISGDGSEKTAGKFIKE